MGIRLGRVWKELRRRRVVSTAAAYLAVAFVLLQLGEILFPAFDLGPGALRLLFQLLLALFPIVLAVSWVYDVTGSGLTRTDGDEEAGPPVALIGGVVASALIVGWVSWSAIQAVPGAREVVVRRSIAVLPFADLSEAGDQAYLGDGVAEEVLNVLAGIDGLQVAARTSSFAFRGNDDIREIGEQLGVATILEGSVRRSGDAVRITAQLIDAESGFHLWSETYDRGTEDLFAVQDEIAGSISEALLGELDLDLEDEGGRYVASPEAQEAYWKGRASWSRRDAAGIPEAMELFNRAIEADSLYAQAYAGLADSWTLLPRFVPVVSVEDALDRAESLARRAISLDPELAEPHASLGLVLAFRRDRVGALLELGRAISLNPSYASALHWRANVLAEMGRLAEALADAERAAAVDPLSPSIATDYGNVLLFSGDLPGALAEYERAQELDFRYTPAILGVVLVALLEEEPVSLQMALTQWTSLSGVPPTLAAQLSTAMITQRATGAPQPVPDQLRTLGTSGRMSAGTVAAFHALLGSGDGAVEWLREALADGSWVDQFVRVNPAFDAVRAHPGFIDVLGEMEG